MEMQHMFDARTVEPAAGFIAVPTADYTVRAIKSEPKQTNDQTGGLLEIELEILDGQYAGQKIMYRLNLWSQKSEQAVKIAWGQLSALCHVTGVFQLQRTEQLHNIPFKVHVLNDGQYANVKYVMDLNGNQPGKRPAAAPAAAPAWPPPAAQAPAAAAPPWGPPQPAQASLPTGPPQQQSWGPTAAQPAAAPPAWTPPGAPQAVPAPAPTSAQPPWMTQPPAAAGPPAAPSWKP
jgi:hypothetical protein